MVRSTSINGFEWYIDLAIAHDDEEGEVIDTFIMLRGASYEHYWAFDKALRNIGIDEGCCSLGTIDDIDYCHTEYPKVENGNTN